MRYIANNTSIPVPKVQRVWCHNGVTYITMDIVDGEELGDVWHKMSEGTKRRVVEQLKGYLGQLRALKPPVEGAVASVTGGALQDGSRVGLESFGPFNTHDDFHQFLRGKGITMQTFEKMNGVDKTVYSHRQSYSTKFTHGDFAPRNIMAKRDGTITAIIDWDSAGWFPEYWEYTKAMFTPHASNDWIERIGEMTGRYDEQLAGERQLYDICGYDLT
ncbi:kinase-like domain-containing protein [Gautieria morchelliformis]|nr:kinase-like domain-containing protein [Gautieria morchelliformis]